MGAGQALAGQPRSRLRREKKVRDELIAEAAGKPDWVLGFQDECWWTRLAQPSLSSWTGGEPLRLGSKARDPKPSAEREAVACYGVLRADTGGMMLRFVAGRPVSGVTEEFLGWVCGELAREGKKVFALVWDNASWHVSERVRRWIEAHNARVGREGGCAIRVCGLPVKAPWLNRIEPKWAHGKRAVAEPVRKLATAELKERVYNYFGCDPQPDLQQAA